MIAFTPPFALGVAVHARRHGGTTAVVAAALVLAALELVGVVGAAGLWSWYVFS